MDAEKQQVPRILIVVSSMAIGGPQKALIGMLQRLHPTVVAVDLMVLRRDLDQLFALVPPWVGVVPAPEAVTAATLPRGRLRWSIRTLAATLRRRTFAGLIVELAKGIVYRSGRQQVRQRVWRRISADLPPVAGSYDAAIGVLGLSTYAVVDLVDARFKYHWIRSDTRILGRDQEIDSAYYAQLTGAVSVSKLCAEIFEEMYPTARGRVSVYKNDIPEVPRHGDAEELVDVGGGMLTILTITRLDPLKGIDLAIDACARLVARGHRVRWLVLGEGREREALERLIDDRDLRGVFLLPGSSLDTGPYMDGADVYVHPSRTEGRSNAVEEARAAGKPIVATAYETVGDQISDGVTGIVCAMDAASIAASIEALIGDPEVGRRLGSQARRDYEAEVCDPHVLLGALAVGKLPDFAADAE